MYMPVIQLRFILLYVQSYTIVYGEHTFVCINFTSKGRMYIYMYKYMYSRRHNKVSVPFLLPFRFLVVLPFLLPFVTVYNRSVF